MPTTRLALAALLIATPALSQAPNDPFPDRIEATEGVIVVGYTEFATLPDVGGERARPMRLVNESGSGRLFVNDIQGPIYTISYDGEVALYLDINEPGWGVPVEFAGRERGVQSFALHPEFSVPRDRRLREAVRLDGYAGQAARARLRVGRRAGLPRHGLARVRGWRRAGSDVRRRTATGAPAGRAALPKPQRRIHRVQPARVPR